MDIRNPTFRPLGELAESLLAKFIVEETDTFGGLQPWSEEAAQETKPTRSNAPASLGLPISR